MTFFAILCIIVFVEYLVHISKKILTNFNQGENLVQKESNEFVRKTIFIGSVFLMPYKIQAIMLLVYFAYIFVFLYYLEKKSKKNYKQFRYENEIKKIRENNLIGLVVLFMLYIILLF